MAYFLALSQVIVLDEAVSALDVLVQNQILCLLNDLQAPSRYILPVHHARRRCPPDRRDVIVMGKGKLRRANTRRTSCSTTVQDYTRRLIEGPSPAWRSQLNLAIPLIRQRVREPRRCGLPGPSLSSTGCFM